MIKKDSEFIATNKKTASVSQHMLMEETGNKIVRANLLKKRRRQEKKEKSEKRRRRHQEAERLGEDAPPRKEPVTIEQKRVYDEQTGQPLTTEEALAVNDEFTQVLAGDVKPKVAVTTGLKPTNTSFDFVRQLLPVIPKSTYFERLDSAIGNFASKATDKGYTDLVIIKEDKRKVSTLTHIHLPEGPTAIYKVSSFIPSSDIPKAGRCTGHNPEIILNNFTTALGLRVGRMLGSLFPHTPNFVGRQVVTFHNQRDFIFFRFHRYVFSASREKARLQELGPRFTLKLRALQKGVFTSPDEAEHEFRWTSKTDINRRRFFL